eukprot:TRINITY_DN29084_c0_g2_i1.p1 TRINITY_DN29084_c0_g2~~TRINITY_DN29084_c0_g2_i1.p1  ORF type:complete len:731 (-),score=177.76 TRINITY_DN29084_c0_g2_i1:77-2155(-)
MASEERGTPAGGGRAAASFLGGEGSTPSASSTAPAELVPLPPDSPHSGRPRRKRAAATGEDSEDWLSVFQALGRSSGSKPSDDALAQCSSIAAEISLKVSELRDAVNKAGLDVGDMGRVMEKLFGQPVATGAINPQDAEKVPDKSSFLQAPDKETSSNPVDAPGRASSKGESSGVKKGRESLGHGNLDGSLALCKHLDGHPSQVYEMDAQVGTGTFGSVRKARHKQSQQIHAVKSVPKKLIPPEELWAEIEIMKQLDHPHVMRIYHTFQDESCVFIASELCEGGELFDAMIQAGALSEQAASKLFKQVMMAVSYCHTAHICHRDLKPENFLCLKKGDIQDATVKLIDFGTAKRFDLHKMTTKVCTINYVAPEVLKKSMEPYTEKVDTWSCGVILFLMLAGVPPFSSDDEVELMKSIKKGKWQFKPENSWKIVSEHGKRLVSKLLEKDVSTRLSAAEAYSDEWCHREDLPSDTCVDADIMTQMRTFVAQSRLKKVALQIIARQVSDDAIEKLRSIFLSVDDDNSGSLTVDEMDEALRRLEVKESVRAEMRCIMHDIDVDGNGEINYTEFIAATISKKDYLQKSVCSAAFDMFDVDGDGVVSKSDLVAVLNAGEQGGFGGINLGDINQLIAEVDLNGDGVLSFEEFMELMAGKDDGLIGMASSGDTKKISGILKGAAKVTKVKDSNLHELSEDE